MKRTFTILSLLMIVAAGIATAQPYKIKLDRPWKVGQKFSVVSWFQSRQTMTVMAGLEQLSQQDSAMKMYTLADGVVKGVDPLEIRYEIFQCVKFIGGDTIEVVPPGTEVVRTGEKGNKVIRAAEGALSEQALADLDDALGNFSNGEADENFGTSKPQRVGGTWKINVPKAVKDLAASADGLEIAEKDVDGTARLIGISYMYDIPIYKIKVDLDIKKLKIPGLSAFQNQSSAAIIQYEGHFPTDEKMGIVKGQLTMTLDIDASGRPEPGSPELTLKGRLTRAQTVEFTYTK